MKRRHLAERFSICRPDVRNEHLRQRRDTRPRLKTRPQRENKSAGRRPALPRERRQQNKKGTQACPQNFANQVYQQHRERAQYSRRISHRPKLGPGGLAEAGDRLRFGVVHIEHREQLGDLEHFLELAAEMAETERCALALGAVMRRDEACPTRRCR